MPDIRTATAQHQLTRETVATNAHSPVSIVSPGTPRHSLPQVWRMLEISRATLYRRLDEFGHALTAKQIDSQWRFSDLDLEFLREVDKAKDDKARRALAQTQAERIATLSAGLGRRDAEAIRRELRAMAEQGELPGVPKRIRTLVERMPHLSTARSMVRLALYFDCYHGTADLARLAGGNAPSVATVERAWRKVQKGVKA